MKTALVVQHLSLGNIGSYGKLLRSKGWDIQNLEAGVHELADADFDAADLVVMPGGPLGANDDPDFPFLADELRVIGRRLRAEKPLPRRATDGARWVRGSIAARKPRSAGTRSG